MSKASTRVAYVVYGGSFDPPHAGHRNCARLALDAFPGGTLLVVPGYQAAGANDQHKASAATYDQRLGMCELAFAGLPRTEISRIERELPTPNYTVTTLTTLAAVGKTPLALLIGQDQLESFHAWRDPGQILALASLAVVARPVTLAASTLEVDLRPSVDRLLRRLGLRGTWNDQGAALHETGTAIHLLGSSAWPVASRDLRAAFAAGEQIPAGWLAPAVDSYIRAQALYGT